MQRACHVFIYTVLATNIGEEPEIATGLHAHEMAARNNDQEMINQSLWCSCNICVRPGRLRIDDLAASNTIRRSPQASDCVGRVCSVA